MRGTHPITRSTTRNMMLGNTTRNGNMQPDDEHYYNKIQPESVFDTHELTDRESSNEAEATTDIIGKP